MSTITINNQRYTVLGNNLYQNMDTQEIVKGEQLSEVDHIDLGSGNNLEGICIGNRNNSRTFTLLSPNISFRGWGNIRKIDLVVGTWLAAFGILGLCVGSILSLTTLSVLTGILATVGVVKSISALYKIKKEAAT